MHGTMDLHHFTSCFWSHVQVWYGSEAYLAGIVCCVLQPSFLPNRSIKRAFRLRRSHGQDQRCTAAYEIRVSRKTQPAAALLLHAVCCMYLPFCTTLRNCKPRLAPRLAKAPLHAQGISFLRVVSAPNST